MTTAAANRATVFSRDLMYQVFRRSIWLNLANRNWEAEFQNAGKVEIPDISAIADPVARTAAQLETAPTYSTSTVTNVPLTAAFIRGHGSINMVDIKRTGPGAALEADLAEKLSIQMAISLDDHLAGVITGGTYNAANLNTLTVGTTGTDFVPRVSPFMPTTAKGMALVVNAIKVVHMLLFRKNVVGGITLGAGEPSPLAVALQPELAATVVNYLEDKGELTDRASIAGQAGVNRGILSSAAYMGTYAGMDIVATNSLEVPASATSGSSTSCRPHRRSPPPCPSRTLTRRSSVTAPRVAPTSSGAPPSARGAPRSSASRTSSGSRSTRSDAPLSPRGAGRGGVGSHLHGRGLTRQVGHVQQSYKTSNCDFYYGGPGFLINLGDIMAGPLVLTGRTLIDRRRNRGIGRRGVTADGVSAGFVTSLTVRAGPAARMIRANPVGVLAIIRHDANYSYAVPMVVSALPTASPSRSALTVTLAFGQAAGTGAVAATPVTAGNYAVGAGEEAYVVNPNSGIVHSTAGGAAPAGGFVVVGSPLVAEGG